jgi:hypothetical protein
MNGTNEPFFGASHFPANDAVTKLINLAIRNFEMSGRNVRE